MNSPGNPTNLSTIGSTILPFAAIDIGSNAVRLLFANVIQNNGARYFRKVSLIRVPLRLGTDSFIEHRISEEKVDSLVKSMKAFKHLIDVIKPVDFKACATSALREAENKSEIVEKIENQSGITVEVIDGEREAQIIYSNHIAEYLEPDKSYLYIDVGGGSTELTLFAQNKVIISESFNIGTIRLLNNLVDNSEWERLKKWLVNISGQYAPLFAIGSGGNINTVFKLSRREKGKPLSYKKIKDMFSYISSFSYQERIEELGLKTDRADVIIPAMNIFLSIMKWGKISKIYVPVIGLLDGIIHILYEKHKETNVTEQSL